MPLVPWLPCRLLLCLENYQLRVYTVGATTEQVSEQCSVAGIVHDICLKSLNFAQACAIILVCRQQTRLFFMVPYSNNIKTTHSAKMMLLVVGHVRSWCVILNLLW